MDTTPIDRTICANADMERRVHCLWRTRGHLVEADQESGGEGAELGILAAIKRVDAQLVVARAALKANETAIAEGRAIVDRLCATFLALRDGSAEDGIDRAAFEAEMAERADWIGDPDASCPHWLEGERLDAWEAAVDAAQRGRPTLQVAA